MSVTPDNLPEPDLTRPPGWRPSLVWLVPVLAALAGLILAARSYMESGPTITISFETAAGIEAHKTEVKYKDVVIGKVVRVALNDDRTHVIATVELSRNGSAAAVKDSRFWVERPRIGVSGVSGINTLLSGAYITVDIGASHEDARHFTGLEKPPALTRDQHGSSFVLQAPDAASLVIGSPVYYRKIPVGRVVGTDLAPDGMSVVVQIFVDAPYNKFVTSDARFWNASGIDLSLNAAGLRVNTQSLATVLAGGIAFQPLSEDDPGPPAAAGAEFTLFSDQASALAPPDGVPEPVVMTFDHGTRGLAIGAPVDFRGFTLGTVTTIEMEFDPKTRSFSTRVSAVLYPDRLGPARRTMEQAEKAEGISHAGMIATLVQHGLRAQLRTGNLLTGQMYVALDLLPHASPASFDANASPLVIPTAPGNLEEVQIQVQDIIRKLDAFPFDEIGQSLHETLQSTNKLLLQLNGQLAPEAQKTLRDAQKALQSLDRNLASPDAPLQQNAQKTLDQVNRAAASLRALGDYLEQHPEALIRGKPAEDEPAPDSGQSAGQGAGQSPGGSAP